jgi:hypothetical protein
MTGPDELLRELGEPADSLCPRGAADTPNSLTRSSIGLPPARVTSFDLR